MLSLSLAILLAVFLVRETSTASLADGWGQNTVDNILKERDDNSVLLIFKHHGHVENERLLELREVVAESVTSYCEENRFTCDKSNTQINSTYTDVMWWNRYPEQRKIEGGSISIRMYVRYPPEMDGTGDTKALIPRDSLKDLLEANRGVIGERFGAELLYILVFDWRKNFLYTGLSITAFLLLCGLAIMFGYARSKQMRSSIDSEFAKRLGLDKNDDTLSVNSQRLINSRKSSINVTTLHRRITSNVDEVDESGEISITDYKLIANNTNATKRLQERNQLPIEMDNNDTQILQQKLKRQKRKRELAMENYFRSITHQTCDDTLQDELVKRPISSSSNSQDQGYGSELVNEKRIITSFHARTVLQNGNQPKIKHSAVENEESLQRPSHKDRIKKRSKKNKDINTSKGHMRLEKSNSAFSDDAIPFTEDEKIAEVKADATMSEYISSTIVANIGDGNIIPSTDEADCSEEAPYFPPSTGKENLQSVDNAQ
ncbi:uncharacterized protein LOC142345921 isoform X2 [Convolutriloba macropyga]|uniref:uncharacterized protein LOC142345921 isoform X2 n=1 Tax=Convolutriloba macropyga TaxID=536237 RepID=UPI003F523263